MDNPSNSFLSDCEALWESGFQNWGRKTGCIFSRDSGLCDEQKSLPVLLPVLKIHVSTWTPEDIPSSLVPKQCLCFPAAAGSGSAGGGEALWITAQARSLTRALPTLYCCLTCWKSLWDWLFSARRAGMEGGKLDGSQFIVSLESTTDRYPLSLPSSTDRLGARARGQHYQSTRSYPQPRTTEGPLPRGTSKQQGNGKRRICCAFKYTCSWPKITPPAAPSWLITQVIVSQVGKLRRSKGAVDVWGAGSSFLA